MKKLFTARAYRVSMNVSQEKPAELADVRRNYIGEIERREQNIAINSPCRFASASSTASCTTFWPMHLGFPPPTSSIHGLKRA